MIIVDYSAIAIAALYANGINEEEHIDENMLRHVILNTLRSYNVKFKSKYGRMVLAMDAGNNWRKDIYPEYKACRKKSRDDSELDWNHIFDILNKISKEIRMFIPWVSLKINKCEADDIIAILAKVYHRKEPIMIVSGDKDFKQLQKHSNVRQWSPTLSKFLDEKDPHGYIFEHVIRGDKGDGVPNILSDDTCLVEGRRQKSVFAKNVAEWSVLGFHDLTEEQEKNLKRNRSVIDFDYMPNEIQELIKEKYNTVEVSKGDKLLDYFIDKRCRTLIDQIADFKTVATPSHNTLNFE